MGLDDYLAQHGPGKLRKLLDSAEEPQEVESESLKKPASEADPATESEAAAQAAEKKGEAL